MQAQVFRRFAIAGTLAAAVSVGLAPGTRAQDEPPDQVLEWNAIFVNALVTAATPNSSSQRLGAIVHTAIFDAYNGIERRFVPIRVHDTAPAGASRRAAVIAAAYTTLVALFPAQQGALLARYNESLAALSDDEGDGGESRQRGIAWGEEVAAAVLSWRAADGFSTPVPAFTGGTEIGQWRPVPPAAAMSAQTLAFTSPFVVPDSAYFRPDAPRPLESGTYANDFNAVKALGRSTGSTRTDDQSALAPFWEGNASVHWNDAANQIARANHLSMSNTNRLLAVLNIAMADTAITVWAAKRFYGADPFVVTWRPATAIPLGNQDRNDGTAPDSAWVPLVTTPSHPEYPAGHPSLNGAAATILRSYFSDAQAFTLKTKVGNTFLPDRTYTSIAQARADGNDARVWGGMHFPSTVTASDDLGELIANYVNVNAMKPVRGPESGDHSGLLRVPGRR